MKNSLMEEKEEPIVKGKFGKLIVFEGSEGVGKSTQAKILFDRLLKEGIDVSPILHDPSSVFALSEMFESLKRGSIRVTPMSEALLFTVAHIELFSKTIFPRIDSGRWVICDRFIGSTLVYQGAGLRGSWVELYLRILREEGITWPSYFDILTIILDSSKSHKKEKEAEEGVFDLSRSVPDVFASRCHKNWDYYRERYRQLGKWIPSEFISTDGLSSSETGEIIWSIISEKFLQGMKRTS